MNTSKKSSIHFTYGTAKTQNFYQLGAMVCFSLKMRSAGLYSKKTHALLVVHRYLYWVVILFAA